MLLLHCKSDRKIVRHYEEQISVDERVDEMPGVLETRAVTGPQRCGVGGGTVQCRTLLVEHTVLCCVISSLDLRPRIYR